MPLQAQAFDGVICNVAIPYTDESQVMREIGRILKRGARVFVLPWIRLFSTICIGRTEFPHALLRCAVSAQHMLLTADRKSPDPGFGVIRCIKRMVGCCTITDATA